jgi:hypothetical protein
MGFSSFLPGRKTSVVLLAALASAAFAGCSSSEPGDGTSNSTAGTGTGTAGTGTGTAGTGTAGTGTATAGTGTAGTGTGTAGTGTAGTGTAGSATAGAGGSGTAGTGTAGSGGTTGVDPTKLDKFSFFVTSLAGLRRLSKSQDGFGGDLRYGTADGLTGADKICTELAESSMPGASAKQWHAFLSTTKVNAKDRIGAGPWYDRTGKLVAMNMAGLLKERPDADAAIKDNLPHEGGIGNHQPVPGQPEDDNHHTLTGSNGQGTLFVSNQNGGTTAAMAGLTTCKDWTSNSRDNTFTGAGVGRPKTGFCWSTQNRIHWIDGQEEGGCGAGVTGVGSVNGGSTPSNPIVGSGGGYGAFYCFAMVP